MISNRKTFISSLILVWIGHFFVDLMVGIWPLYKTMAHLDLAIAGIISAVGALIGEGMQIVFGGLSDKGYRKHLIIFGLAATSFCTLMSYTTSSAILFLLYIITCLGSGAFHPSATSLVGNMSATRKGFLITLFWSGGAFGLAFSQILFIHIFYLFDGHTTILAIPVVILAIILWLARLEAQKLDVSPSRPHFSIRIFKEYFKRKDLSLLYVSQVCNQAIAWGFIFLLPDVLVSREYDSWIIFGGGHFFYIIGGACMAAPCGYLADKYSSKLIITVSTLIALVLYYLFLFIPSIPAPMLIAMLFAIGASLSIVNPVSVAFGNRLAPENPGMVSAFLMGLVWCVSEGIGQAGGGLLTKAFTNDAPAKALGILGGLFFVGIAVSLFLPAEETTVSKERIIP